MGVREGIIGESIFLFHPHIFERESRMIYRAFLVMALLLSFLMSSPRTADAEKSVKSGTSTEKPRLSVLREIERVFIGVAERVKPAVVSIRAESRIRLLSPGGKEKEKGKETKGTRLFLMGDHHASVKKKGKRRERTKSFK